MDFFMTALRISIVILTAVALVLSGNVHEYSMTLVLAVSVAIYALAQGAMCRGVAGP
jgi:hypothetical protein